MTHKHYLSANEFIEDSWRLAAQVRKSDWRPDWLVALWRGGAPVGTAVHEFLCSTGWDLRHVPLKCASYSGIESNEGKVVFTLGDETLDLIGKGEKVLVVDDVFDTGKTAAAIKSRFDAAGVEMRLACVYWKPGKNMTDLKPDYFVRDVGNGWIVFPHEIDGLSPAEVRVKNPILADLLDELREAPAATR